MITFYAVTLALGGMLGCVGVPGIHAQGVRLKMILAMIEAAKPPPTGYYQEQAEKQFQVWRELVKDK